MQTLNDLIQDVNKYWAHLPKKGTVHENETLEEHSNLVLDYANRIIDKYELKPIIQKLIKNSFDVHCTEEDSKSLYELFLESILFHDLGKINPNFQVEKMKNLRFKQEQLEFGSNHSLPGFVLFIQNKFHTAIEIPEEKENEFDVYVAFICLLGFQIAKHHSSYLDDAPSYIQYKFNYTDCDIDKYLLDVIKLLERTNYKEHPDLGLRENENIGKIVADTLKEMVKNPFPLFALLKLHYSLLTASDYLATTHYMNNWKNSLTDFGIISEELRNRIIQNVQTTKDYNQKVFGEIDEFDFTYPTEPNNENLNHLRQELSVEVIQNIRKNKDKKVFYIEAPTGSGKTNLSMLAAAELLKQHEDISNLYYVFPFTTLITQTYDSLKETMGLEEDEIIQLHSKEGFKEKSEGEFGQDKKNHIDYLFLNYPVALLSHVKFFNILKTNCKQDNYLLHRLANSIVVVDELQSYPPKIWDKLIYFIQNYADYFNIRFILMSATLPKLDKLSNVATNICYLTNHKKEFFQNPNFCKRVEFDFSLLEWETPEKQEKPDYLNKLGEFVIEQSKDYAFKNTKYPDSVFTIIEFIYKQTATEFYSVISELSDGFFDKIFVLSGTILEPRRKEIIHYLKNPDNRNKKLILITTQVVEAGVDIDMDLGFKDKSLVDSDEQLAGRINRNVNKPACTLYLFNCDNADVLYGKDKRYRLLQNELAGLDREILESKDFDKMYDRVMCEIDKSNNRNFQEGFNDFKGYLKMLNFPEVDTNFKIINQQSTSVFVPIDVDVFVPGTDKKVRNFSEKEIEFLNNYNVKISCENKVSGSDVFKLYERIIKQKDDDFIGVKTELKKLQGIMSKFIFSLMTHSKSMQNLVLGSHGNERMGIYYLSHWKEDKTYNYEFGLSEKNEAAIIL